MTDSSGTPSTPTERPVESAEPSIADGTVRRLDPRAISFHRVVGWIVTAVISGVLAIAAGILAATGAPYWVKLLVASAWLPMTLALAWLGHRWPEVEHRHLSYTVDALGIEIRRGVWWRQEVHVPRSRVQHTDVSQGPLERHFGLGTLRIYTAGTQHAQVELGGLAHETALQVRDHLLSSRGDDAV